MKIAPRDATTFIAGLPGDLSGLLIFSDDPGLVVEYRQSAESRLTGGQIDDLRIIRLDAADARRDASLIDAGLKTPSFFSGRPIVVIEGGTDGLSKSVDAASTGLSPDDGFLLVTAGSLTGKSPLRKLFEASRTMASLQLFPVTVDPGRISAMVAERGASIDRDAAAFVAEVAADLDHGSLRQLIEVLALSGLDRDAPLDLATARNLVPAGLDTDIERFVNAVATGNPSEVGLLLRQLEGSGANPVTLSIALQRHFRTLFRAAEGSGGVAALRPPVFGARKDALARQLRLWSGSRLEHACRLLFETDGRLRSSSNAPAFALLERCVLRLSMMAQG